jgi:iron complex outermembrane receptor protein
VAGYGYTDAKFTDFDGTGLNDGNRLPNAPRSSLNAGLRLAHRLNDALELIARADYQRTGRLYFSEDNHVYQPAYATTDAQLGVAGERWTLTAWAKNLFDKRFVTSAYSRAISPLIFGALQVDPYQIDPGSTYGLEFRWSMGGAQ